MTNDWKDLLSAMRSDMPDAPEETPARQEPESDTGKNIQKEKLHIVMEKKGRKGKTDTIIAGFICDDDTLQHTARLLKQRIGTGGSARGGEILLQGDWRQRAAEELRSLGFKI